MLLYLLEEKRLRHLRKRRFHFDHQLLMLWSLSLFRTWTNLATTFCLFALYNLSHLLIKQRSQPRRRRSHLHSNCVSVIHWSPPPPKPPPPPPPPPTSPLKQSSLPSVCAYDNDDDGDDDNVADGVCLQLMRQYSYSDVPVLSPLPAPFPMWVQNT